MPARRPPSTAGPAPAQPAPAPATLEFWKHRLKTARARVQTLDAHLQGLRAEREETATAFERLRAQARDALVAAGLERCRQPWLLPLLRTWLAPFLAETPEMQSGEALATVYLLAAGALTDSQLQLLQLRQQGATLAELGAQHQVSKEWIRQCLEQARADAVAAVKTMCAAPDSITILHRHEHPLAGLPTPMPDPPATPGIPDLPPGTWPLELSTRTSNALLMANVYSLDDPLTRSPQELLNWLGRCTPELTGSSARATSARKKGSSTPRHPAQRPRKASASPNQAPSSARSTSSPSWLRTPIRMVRILPASMRPAGTS